MHSRERLARNIIPKGLIKKNEFKLGKFFWSYLSKSFKPLPLTQHPKKPIEKG